MEVDEVIQNQVCKFQRVSSNGTDNNNSTSLLKIATSRANLDVLSHVDDGGIAQLSRWPSSRIVRVSRASGGKDRHSKVLTSKGLRDRRVRLSVGTAIQFYDLQDRLGFDQPSKAVEWLLKAAASSIDELPGLNIPIPGVKLSDGHGQHRMRNENEVMVNRRDLDSNNIVGEVKLKSKSPSCSSASETSKGESELSLSRSDNRVKARERAKLLALKKEREKEKEINSSRDTVFDQVNSTPDTSSFTDLLTGRCQMEYLFNRPVQASTPAQLFQMQQFNFSNGDNLHHFSSQDGFPLPVTPVGGIGGGERNYLNFSTPLSSGCGVSPSGFTRGTLQSNLQTSILPHHHYLQRFQSPSVDGSNSMNVPFLIFPNAVVDHFPPAGGYNLSFGGGGDGGGRYLDHHKEKARN